MAGGLLIQLPEQPGQWRATEGPGEASTVVTDQALDSTPLSGLSQLQVVRTQGWPLSSSASVPAPFPGGLLRPLSLNSNSADHWGWSSKYTLLIFSISFSADPQALALTCWIKTESLPGQSGSVAVTPCVHSAIPCP